MKNTGPTSHSMEQSYWEHTKRNLQSMQQELSTEGEYLPCFPVVILAILLRWYKPGCPASFMWCRHSLLMLTGSLMCYFINFLPSFESCRKSYFLVSEEALSFLEVIIWAIHLSSEWNPSEIINWYNCGPHIQKRRDGISWTPTALPKTMLFQVLHQDVHNRPMQSLPFKK